MKLTRLALIASSVALLLVVAIGCGNKKKSKTAPAQTNKRYLLAHYQKDFNSAAINKTDKVRVSCPKDVMASAGATFKCHFKSKMSKQTIEFKLAMVQGKLQPLPADTATANASFNRLDGFRGTSITHAFNRAYGDKLGVGVTCPRVVPYVAGTTLKCKVMGQSKPQTVTYKLVPTKQGLLKAVPVNQVKFTKTINEVASRS